jgi:hypothetical protein
MNDRGVRADRKAAHWNEDRRAVRTDRTPVATINLTDWVRRAMNSVTLSPSAHSWHGRLRATRGYDVVMGTLGSVWFFILALLMGFKALRQAEVMSAGEFSSAGLSALLATACLILFYLALWWFMLVRRSPAARSDGLLPSLIAFTGSYLPWIVVLFGGNRSTRNPTAHLLARDFDAVPDSRCRTVVANTV